MCRRSLKKDMLYKKCGGCGANLDCGEICDCITNPPDKNKPDFSEILAWAKTNQKKYPALAQLKQESIDGTYILRLDVPFGGSKKQGLVITYDKNIADEFRCKDYAAAVVGENKTAQQYICDCVTKWVKYNRKA